MWWVHKIRLHGRRGKGRLYDILLAIEKIRQAPQKEGGEKINSWVLCGLPPVRTRLVRCVHILTERSSLTSRIMGWQKKRSTVAILVRLPVVLDW